ncbi:MAG: thiamine-phosphate kinase [Nevskiales bacterium]
MASWIALRARRAPWNWRRRRKFTASSGRAAAVTNEFEIIRRYFQRPPKRPDVVLGSGDDAALLQPPPGMLLAATTDTLVAGRHFHDDWPAADIGWRALAVNLSDLAAMGAQPAWFTCALTVPEADEKWLAGFAQGLFELAAQYPLDLVGGNLSCGPLSITIQALGFVAAEKALRRDAARPGDLICVTGTLGDASLALQLLDTRPPNPPSTSSGQALPQGEGEQSFSPPRAEGVSKNLPPPRGEGLREGGATDAQLIYLTQRLRRPTPRIAAGLALAGVAHAAIDISDGLAADLGHVLAASGVGAEIRTNKLPMSPAFARLAPRASRLPLQLSGGDDYELCICLPQDKLAAVQARLNVPLTVIGAVTATAGLRDLSTPGGQRLTPAGYDHFPNI